MPPPSGLSLPSYRILDCPDHPAWVADGKRIVGYILYYNTARKDDAVISDCDTGNHGHIGSEPHVVAHPDRLGILQPQVPFNRFKRMPRGIESTVGSYEL